MKTGIIGASGYGGGELVRLLSQHPDIRLTTVVSDTYAGKPPSAAFPGLVSSKLSGLKFIGHHDIASVHECDVVFLAQENGKAMHLALDLLNSGCKVIDLSADFRFRNIDAYPEWYGFEHAAPDLSKRAVYGLPELYKSQIKVASLVGNPGCYPTASILALAPLLKNQLIDLASIIIDAKSGVSGAGRSKFSQAYHFPEANESVSAYGVGGKHRHIPEIEQALSQVADVEVKITFTPHLIPMSRGILATCYGKLREASGASALEIRRLFEEYYSSSPFVHVLPEGTPASKFALGANGCFIGLEVDSRTGRVIVISAIDNLVKGMAGQAIQNMNLMCGFDEQAGLDICSVWP